MTARFWRTWLGASCSVQVGDCEKVSVSSLYLVGNVDL